MTVFFIFQEKVLLNIMPIFTFMGTNILRLDDAYSFRVINKTVQMVIPALIQVSRTNRMSAHITSSPIRPKNQLKVHKRKFAFEHIQARRLSEDSSAHVDAVVTRIIHVFADALPHVPDHRRLPLLGQLVETLGPARFLWVLMLLLFKLHATPTASTASEKVAHLRSNLRKTTRSRLFEHTPVGLSRTQQ